MQTNIKIIDYFPALEFGITEDCNLKCASCLHYMPLIDKPETISLEQFRIQIDALKNYTNITNQIKLSGGEPLLNPNILEFCKILRQTWSYAHIWIITNGILLKTKDDNFFNTLNNLHIGIEVSNYFNDPEILNILNTKIWRHQVWPKEQMINPRYNFSNPINSTTSGYTTCYGGSSYKIPFIRGNYIYHCAIDAFSSVLEEKFNFKIDSPNRELTRLDIRELSKEKIKDFWKVAPDFCSYCYFGGNTPNCRPKKWTKSNKQWNEWLYKI